MIRNTLAAAAVAVASLSTTCAEQPSATQTWDFTLDLEGAPTTATAACTSDGSCVARSWVLSADAECTVKIDFAVHFRDTTVALDSLTRAADSCTSGPTQPRPDATGTGVADAPYPEARIASGVVTLAFVGVLYVPGGPAPVTWHARQR